MKMLYENGNPCNEIKIYEHKGHKFRFQFHHANAIGYFPTLSVMCSDGTWCKIESSETLNVKWESLYYLDIKDGRRSNLSKFESQNEPVEKAFIAYIKAVY